MKLKRKIGISLAVAAATYCVLAYIFMWSPVVRYYWNGRAQKSFPPCVDTLRRIDSAIDVWAAKNGKHPGDPVTIDDILPYYNSFYGLVTNKNIFPCYEGGTYSITVVGRYPTCSLGTNSSVPLKMRRGYFNWDFTNILGCCHRLSLKKEDPDWDNYVQYHLHPRNQFLEYLEKNGAE